MRGGGEGDLKNDAAHVADGLAFLDVLFRVSGFRGKTSKMRCCISRIWRLVDGPIDGLAFLDVLLERPQLGLHVHRLVCVSTSRGWYFHVPRLVYVFPHPEIGVSTSHSFSSHNVSI